ncbi:hypothetical protein [Aromatoleum diolicum]|uniref:Uncharacterized protein n=1 Tax=Aromatoleum diolicum TaxID=75796 RepID=A0ABX1QJN3_9RHOO|nr:hypothetical protein [Aromatoleum diolicum]NMG77485.1 hypothetical protein [Aromatoleum diolicum]
MSWQALANLTPISATFLAASSTRTNSPHTVALVELNTAEDGRGCPPAGRRRSRLPSRPMTEQPDLAAFVQQLETGEVSQALALPGRIPAAARMQAIPVQITIFWGKS